MPRVTTTSGEILDEIIAPKVTMDWNAVTNGGQIFFHMARLISLDGVPVAQQDLGSVLVVSIAELLPRSFPVVVGQDADGNDIVVDVPTKLVMGAIKSGFSTLFDEKIGELPSLVDSVNAGMPAPPLEEPPLP